MHRYLLATSLSFSILTVVSTPPQAEPAFEVAQAQDGAPAGGGGQQPSGDHKDEHKDKGDQKGGGDHRQGHEGGGPKGGGAPPERSQNGGQEHRDRGDRGGPPNKPPAQQAQPQNSPQVGPGDNGNRRDNREDRRERARDQVAPLREPQPRAIQTPSIKPVVPNQIPRRDELPDRRFVPQQAQPQPKPAPTPSAQGQGEGERGKNRDRGDRDRGPSSNKPPQQAQPQPNPNPTPAAQGSGDSERGKNRDHGDRDRGPSSNKPPQQAQPSSPPPGGRPDDRKDNGAPPPSQAGTPPSGQGKRGDNRQFGGPGSIDEIKRGRRQRVEDGGKRTIIEEPGNRTIVQEKGAPAMIRHDEGERMRRTSRDVRSERRPDGGSLSIAIRPGGIEVYSEFDNSGRLMRRYRRDHDGRELDLIDNRRFRGRGPIIIDLAPPRFSMPRDRYIMDYDRSSDEDLYDMLMDGPVDRLDRGYSLDEIRYNGYLRDRMRRVDLDTVNFEFGAWQVPYDQYNRLERIAGIINRILDRHPDEVFMIEGHTDAVGSDIDNLTLSDRRAEEVAVILTETFGVPPENLITQGYGEEFLKIPTAGPEIINRRVAVRRITPLLARDR
jgi:outer membrane protein OmpA-like peptidoglycan-associated protein